jgi:hypothetical protein
MTPLIRSNLIRCLAGEMSLDDFKSWFVAHTWDVDGIGDRSSTDLAHDIDLALVESSSGHLSEAELRDALRTIANTVVLDIAGSDVQSFSSSTLTILPNLFLDRRPAKESA